MNDDRIRDILLKLLRAQNSQAVARLLQEDEFFRECEWWPYGNTESNFSVISAQAKESVNALVEKIVNSIDALLLAECLKRKVDPKSSRAPSTMSEAVKEFFGIPNGDISTLTDKERRTLAQNIMVIADGDKEKPNISIVDTGEGQNPDVFWQTFLSLPTERSNKADIKFVQGKYNMGGTGALMFCGKPGEHYQLILSKRNPKVPDSKNLWGFTLVRQTIKEGSKNPLFECLVAPTGEFYSFESNYLNLLPDGNKFHYGTFIKLYSYYLKNPSNINLDLWRPLNRKLFIAALPIMLYETRFEKEKIHGATRIMEGNKFRINGEEHKWVEKYFPIQSDLANLGSQTIEVTVFKDQVEESVKGAIRIVPFPTGEFTSPTEAIFFTVNGQTHHTIGRSTLETQANLRNLAKYLMIHIDVTSVGPILSEIFHGARESARENETYKEIEERLLSDLKDNPLLRSLDEEYRKREIAKIQPDKGFVKKTAARILKDNPDWAKKLLKGVDIPLSQTKGKPKQFTPSYIPTFLELKGEKVKLVPINNKYSWIYLLTDAPDDYLIRKTDKGELKLESSIPLGKAYWLNEGMLSLKIIVPKDIAKGFQAQIKVILSRPDDTDLEEKVVIQFTKERFNTGGPSQPRQPKGEDLSLPEPDFVEKNRWSEFTPEWDAKEIAQVDGSVIHINRDSYDLHGFLSRYERKYKRDSIIEAYQTAIYLYAFIIDSELSETGNEELIMMDNKGKLVSKIMRGIAKVVLPLNFEGFLDEVN